jgi:large subunit ribosomal protein L22
MVRGKKISDAKVILQFLGKKASPVISKLLDSAVSNAVSQGVSEKSLLVKSIAVVKGPTLKRIRPRSRGMANRINKRTSHIKVELAEVK